MLCFSYQTSVGVIDCVGCLLYRVARMLELCCRTNIDNCVEVRWCVSVYMKLVSNVFEFNGACVALLTL